MIKVKIKTKEKLPVYETTGSAGMDVRSINEDFILHPGERKLVKTGLFMEIPEGYEVQIRPRSGLAYKHGITVLNSPGTIDSDYRGEIGVVLINHGTEPFKVNKGERIGQLVLNKVEQMLFKLVENLEVTERGDGGFGSTDKKEEIIFSRYHQDENNPIINKK